MKDVRFEFERPTWWYESTNYVMMGPVAYARDCFKSDKDEIYDTVRDLEREWKASRGELANYSAFIDPMNTDLVFIRLHVYPLEIEDGGEYKEGWEVTIRGSVHVRVKDDPTDEAVWEDIQQCLDDCCGDVHVVQ